MPRILYVEDNPDNFIMLQRRLTRAGYDVSVAMNGAQGVEAATLTRPDLIVMDLNLPGIDGWEATRRLKAQAETRAIPVIALSAHSGAAHRAEAMAAGCVEFEPKPVDFDRLLGKIQAVLNAKPGPA